MYKKVRILQIVSMAVLLAGLSVCATGCGQDDTVAAVSAEDETVKIPMILTIDSSTGNKNEEDVVTAFNEAYAGQYEIEVEWIMETEEEYRQNLKTMNATDELPAIITDLRMLPSFYEMMIADERIVELTPYILEDDEWLGMMEDVTREAVTEEDGKIYLAPLSTAAFSCAGVFWNEELFAEAGITEFPETWEEFWECCDTLQQHGITPLALHTEGTAWAPMLLATAKLADTEEGAAFMEQMYPESYTNESGLKLAETLARLFTYTSDEALYSDFDVAYDLFFSGEAAMLPNGYWMIDQIPEEQQDNIRFSAFPGNKLISSPETFGWAIVSDYSDEIKEGAVAFFKFRTQMNLEKKEQRFSMDASELTQAENDYIAAYNANPQIVPNYQVKWNSILQEETLGEYLPKLILGEISAEEFTQAEDESVRQFLKEQ